MGREEEERSKEDKSFSCFIAEEEERGSGAEKKELVPAHISCFNMFSGARQKVGVKQSYGQRYCSIVLKCNYVSSGGLLCTPTIDWCLYFASV